VEVFLLNDENASSCRGKRDGLVGKGRQIMREHDAHGQPSINARAVNEMMRYRQRLNENWPIRKKDTRIFLLA
jgi:hypothetical protein